MHGPAARDRQEQDLLRAAGNAARARGDGGGSAVMTPHAACSECRELIGGYVLDALEPDETAAVRRHLAECPECASEHASLADIPVLLDLAGATEVAREQPPPQLEEAVLDSFAREQATTRSSRRRARALLAPF